MRSILPSSSPDVLLKCCEASCSIANCPSAAAAAAAAAATFARSKATLRNWKERVFSTYHVALSLAVVTVGAIVGLEVGGNGALGGHCV